VRGRRILVVSLVVAALAAATANAALTPPQYRARMTAICKASKRAIDKLGQPKTKAGLTRFIEATVPIGDREIAAFRAIDPPARFATAHKKILAIDIEQVALIRRVVKDIHAGTDPAVAFNKVNARGTQLGKVQNGIYRSLGLPACLG
jgi:hypothetical protein